MKKAYKTELKLTDKQAEKVIQNLGVCRWLYNEYLGTNQKLYKDFKDGKIVDKTFITAIEFDKYINNEVKTKEEFKWINDCGSKARKKAICNAEKAFMNFFNKKAKFPNFKKKNKCKISLYFPKNNKTDWEVERHRIKIPTLGWVRLKEFGYIPTNLKVISGIITKKADKYYVSVIFEATTIKNNKVSSESIGIDLGLKDFAVISNGEVKKNINKTKKIKDLEKKLKREQKSLSRKYESEKQKKLKKGEATRQNIYKQVIRIQKLHKRLTDVRTDYINKIISEVIDQKPKSITIEDLNIKGMMKNRHLAKSVSNQKFYEFRVKLENKCKENDIELRIVDRWYASSKICSRCGNTKKELKLSERKYTCEKCGIKIDRDLNASINLKEANTYNIA
ncbi:transposase [Candidatus Epulonipiscium fishelsonii]|nr:transposase [Epulopiscium sp. SCG-B05WGA-EpuloA1]